MAHTLMYQAWTVVNYVMLVISVQVWACHQRLNVKMGHTPIQVVLCIVCCVQLDTGEWGTSTNALVKPQAPLCTELEESR